MKENVYTRYQGNAYAIFKRKEFTEKISKENKIRKVTRDGFVDLNIEIVFDISRY